MNRTIDIEIDQDKLSELYFLLSENNGKYHGMTYEQGIMAMIDIIEGNADLDELIADYN